MGTYVYAYAAVGLLVAIWFYWHMRGWAQVGNRMGSNSGGSLKLLLMLPVAPALWPFTAWMLFSDRR